MSYQWNTVCVCKAGSSSLVHIEIVVYDGFIQNGMTIFKTGSRLWYQTRLIKHAYM